jgi:hypothetical protein
MPTAWDHLPNKILIDQVFEDLTNHPTVFAKAYNQAWAQSWSQARDQAGEQVRVQARKQALKQAWNQAYSQARAQVYHRAYSQARDQARDHALVHAYYVVQTALLSLIAYDDASKYLIIPADQAMVYGELVSNGQYTLLKPYLLLKHEIALLATA